jgi:NAD dependent epimerase/dehydratase family enzyme
MSWISMEDALGSIFHVLKNTDIQGPVNLTAPNPVTNRMFTRTLARVLSRPALFSIPEWLAVRLWGEMGRETLLTSARVMPEKLMKNRFVFQYPDLETALRHVLGRIDS